MSVLPLEIGCERLSLATIRAQPGGISWRARGCRGHALLLVFLSGYVLVYGPKRPFASSACAIIFANFIHLLL
jgi:hypothetical protein